MRCGAALLVPQISSAYLGGDDINSRAETVLFEYGECVLGKVFVSVIKSKQDRLFSGDFSCSAPSQPIGSSDALVSAPCQPFDLRFEFFWGDCEALKSSVAIRSDVVIKEHWQLQSVFPEEIVP